VTTANNGAYQRFVYGPNYVQTFATVNTIADEAYSFQLADVAGRTIAAARNHPGSVGGYSAVVTVFDQIGRAVKQSNPTETTASGTTCPATGDDAYNARTGEGDWRYTEQTYDWQGRPRIRMHEDPASQSVRATETNGGFENNPSLAYNAELDPVRADAEREDPYLNQEPYEPPDENSPDPMGFGNPTRPRRGCIWNGMPIPDCSAYFDLLSPFDLTLADARRSLETYRLQAAGHVDVYENPPGSFDGNKLRVKTLHIGIIPLYRLVPSAMFFSSSLTTTFARSAAAGPQNTYTYLNRDQVSSLIDDVYKMFKNNPGCEEWTNKLLGELANSTGFDAGSIRDILEDFRQNGRVRVGQARGVRAGAADPALITLSVDSAQNRDAPTIMGEIIHSAGMPSRFPGGLGGYPWHYYTDEAMATAAAKFGTVMTAAQYRHTYPEDIKKRFAAGWQADFVEGSLAHGAIEIICNKGVNSLSPKYAKP